MKTINSFSSKLFALALVLVTSVSSFAHDFSVDGIYYNVLDDNNVEVTYKGSSIYEVEYRDDVVIPDSVLYNGVNYVVASIGKDAFSYSYVKSVIIGNNVKTIGNNAFSNNSLLASVTMGSNVQSIGNSAFYNCSYLGAVNSLPNTLINIGASAFRACSNLTTIHMPDNLTTIGEYAFYECYKLTSVILGNNVTNIEGMAFMYCKALKSITLPNITHIGSSAFNNCLSLDSVTLGNGLRNIADNLFYQCSSLTHITIPDSIECIGEHAFYNCKLLKTIYIPNTVNMIGKYAFSGCSSLDSIHIPNGVTEMGEYTFENCTSLQAVNLPKTISSIRYYAFAGCASLTEINIPEGVQKIESNTFENCTSLLKITIPNSVMTIELDAFSNTGYYNDANNWEEDVLYISNCLIEAKNSIAGDYNIKQGTQIIADYALFGCHNLTSITFPESLKSIGDAAFYKCTNMSVINMSDSLQKIGNRAFAYCELLNPVTIPVGVKIFGEEVFMGCKSLVSIIWNAKECQDFSNPFVAPFYRISSKITSITFGDEVEYIPAGMCYGLSAVPSVTIPVNVKRIGKDAFESCTSMTSITWNAKHYCDTLDYPPFEGLEYVVKSFTFGEGIETIPPYICKEMREVSEIIIPKGVKSIGRHAFNYCLGIPSVTIPKGVTTIGSAAFFHTQIRSVIVPEGVTEIGGWAFSECYGLNKIELPSTLKSIGNSAFKETYYIDTLICKALVPPTMGELAVFEGVKQANISLFVPKESIELYKKAEQWKEFGQILPLQPTTIEDLFPTLWGLQRTVCNEYCGDTEDDNSANSTYKQTFDSIFFENDKPYILCNDYLLREEDNKILIYSQLLNKDLVLYDFTLEVGDSLPALYIYYHARNAMDWIPYNLDVVDYNKDFDDGTIYPADTFVVTDISNVTLLDGKEYKKWTFDNGMEYVEGIGMYGGRRNGNFFGLIQDVVVPCHMGEHLVCVSKNGKLLYQMDDAEMERLGAECLCDVNIEDDAKDGKLGGRPTPTQWNIVETKEVKIYQMPASYNNARGNSTAISAETFAYELLDDTTIINDKKYLPLICSSTKESVDSVVYVGALHFNKENKVYFHFDNAEHLLYDFSAEVGDTLELFAGINNYPEATTYTHVVTGKDTLSDGATIITLDAILYEEIHAQTVEHHWEKVWIAGVGSIDGIVHNSARLHEDNSQNVMLCVWLNDVCVYTTHHPDYQDLGCVYNTNDITAVEDVESEESSAKKIIQDGQFFIVRDGKTYTVLGHLVE